MAFVLRQLSKVLVVCYHNQLDNSESARPYVRRSETLSPIKNVSSQKLKDKICFVDNM